LSDVTVVEKKKRRRFKQVDSLEDRLAADTEGLRERLKQLPIGPARDDVLRRIKQNDAAVALSQFLRGTG
jgi:hypothetical protein